ncbi:hypothetical protein IQ251_10550 [Saccharopolyspora sp. HNM0983]|uniref:Uncharacterized protein n=1 Tax=Saccharopolyspora montiporae TaxID=2781240 RepID=A0A929B7Y2_9PSEU|nr:hypothetical protein [Saccharopolyspora sp. HNM0983]MBE9374882.1 hypothetical protein [Saccharopolyspora sp. HNM0983]
MSDRSQLDESGSSAGEAPAVPEWLRRARWVWLGAMLLGLLASVVQLADRETLVAEIRERSPELSQQEVDAATNSGILFTLLVSALTLMVVLLLTNRMLQGVNWARLVLTAWAGFEVFAMFITAIGLAVLGRGTIEQLAGQSVSAVELLAQVLVTALEIAAIVLMFRPEVNEYFRRMRPRLRRR